ncbi:caspase family protein [Labrys wisconsinensis]|uniref:Tetratricopeptide (TPR) repeat protein n=1 Tax=Labrys wisconsinensis TaxID=425677 RepID=A0ABU0JIM8_9HYPH|nr:caspase family protein [Labrys wisconsinensis]MDQ0473129.1 tetratricopeptide (TPR) repeat protein [Labrys wisconsinensis]
MRTTLPPGVLLLLLALCGSASAAPAQDNYAACNGGNDHAGIISACSWILDRGDGESVSNRKNAFFYRGLAYQVTDRLDQAIDDYHKALALDAAFGPAIQNLTVGLNSRASAALDHGDSGGALAAYDESIRLNPKNAVTFGNRAVVHLRRDELGLAVADCMESAALDPKYILARDVCGRAYLAQHDYANAVTAFTQAFVLDPHFSDGEPLSMADALKQAQAALAPPTGATVPAGGGPPSAGPPEVRVALVIGNSHYAAVGALPNPQRDADLVAAALRQDGFTSVVTVDDLSRQAFVAVLRDFEAKADKADWAVVYYAGHGLEIGGVNYLVPVDARLESDRDVPDEAIPLDRILSAVSGAGKLRLIVLDACRNNPFLAQMKRTSAERSVGRGLARVEPDQATLIAYSAKDGSTAEDGDGGDSPFAAALAKRFVEPDVEINKVFREVREDVLKETGRRQEPFVYGSLPPTDFYFTTGKAH